MASSGWPGYSGNNKNSRNANFHKAKNGSTASISNISVAGQWKVDQYYDFKGIFNLQQTQSGQLTGNVSWERYESGTINGQVSGSSIEFTISYPNGLISKYKGTVTQNGIKISNGTVHGSDGSKATWEASKVVAFSSIAGKWNVNQNYNFKRIFDFKQNQSGQLTGNVT